MNKLLMGVAALPLMTGVASAAETLSDVQLDRVSAGAAASTSTNLSSLLNLSLTINCPVASCITSSASNNSTTTNGITTNQSNSNISGGPSPTPTPTPSPSPTPTPTPTPAPTPTPTPTPTAPQVTLPNILTQLIVTGF